MDGVGQQYSDKTESYAVRKYIDPSLIGVNFSAAVVETLNSAGSITVNFTVGNTGSLTMQNLVLRESEYGEIYRLETFEPGTQSILSLIHISMCIRDSYGTMELTYCGGTWFSTRRLDTGALGRMHFLIRNGKAWGVQVYTRIYQRIEA